MQKILIDIQKLSKNYLVGKKILRAVNNLSFSIYSGETLGLVGESGSGKSTLGRLLLRLVTPSSGKIFFEGEELLKLSPQEMKKMRRKMQMIFQDPYNSLDPHMKIRTILAEPFHIHKVAKGIALEKEISQLLQLVGLEEEHKERFPHEFSGGQRQRIAIARALSLRPQFIVCDEPISSLDVTIQAQIIHLLKQLQTEKHLTYLFISHDLAAVKSLATRLAVMYLGEFMELGPSEEIYKNPLHPYTQALLSAVAIPDPILEKKRERIFLKSEIPNPLDPPKGCPFSSRCPLAIDTCYTTHPEWREISPAHFIACHRR